MEYIWKNKNVKEEDDCTFCNKNDWEYFYTIGREYPIMRMCRNCGNEEWNFGDGWGLYDVDIED